MAHKRARSDSDGETSTTAATNKTPRPFRPQNNNQVCERPARVESNPACPGVVKVRSVLNHGTTTKLIPSAPEVQVAFTNLKADEDLLDEGALLEFMFSYEYHNIPLSLLLEVYYG